jgi:integrase
MLRDCWYGVYTDGGKRKVENLGVKWRGTPPESGRVKDKGDEVFEQSRRAAEAKLSSFTEDAKRKGRAEHLTERLIEAKTGRALEYCKITELPNRWRTMGRDSSASDRYFEGCDAHFRRFIEHMTTRNPAAVYLYEITEADAAAFMAACRLVLAPGTAKDCTQLVSKALARFLPVGAANPFSSFAGRRGNGETGIIHRKPFTPDELRALLDAARGDKFMYPLVVTAAMTGMRRGDVCNLQWSAVDLSGGMLAVKTSKTDAKVEIPIFPMLRKVLVDLGGNRKGEVFTEAAEMLRENPDGLTWRFKKIVAQAFVKEPSDLVPAEEIEAEAVNSIQSSLPAGPRRERMLAVLQHYVAGQSVRQIEKAMGIARANVSTDLNTIEVWIGKKFVRGGTGASNIKGAMTEVTRVARGQGQRAASVRDWHALRVTWITFALAAGVPMEIVRRVTGHATVDIVLKHYFRPDREQFRAVLQGALPKVLTGGKSEKKAKKKSSADTLADLVAKIQAGTATEKDKKKLRLLAANI